MPTAAQMILRSLNMIGEKPLGATLTTAENTAHLYALNSMMDSWGIERLMCYQIVQEAFSLVAGTASYTIGSGGTFNTTRPVRIVDPCFVRDSSNYDSPVTILEAADSYGKIGLKSSGNTYPSHLFYDTAWVAGLGTIYVYPKPSSGLTLYINSWKQLQTFSTVSDSLSLPPGYQLAIEANYAVHAAAGFRPVSAEVALLAKTSKAAIKGLNAPAGIARLDPGLVGRGARSGHSILTGP